MDITLTTQEAFEFLSQKLKISRPAEKFASEPAPLLADICRSYLNHVPFQNITLLSQDKTSCHVPTGEEMKTDVLSGRGGLCFTLNCFLYALLKAVGYDVSMALAQVGTDEIASHVVVLIRNLVQVGSLHIVDVGFGYPHFEPVSLDFDKETPEFRQSFNTFKYSKEGELYQRLHKASSEAPPPGFIKKDGWVVMYTFQLTPATFGEMDYNASPIYCWPSHSHFHQVLRLVKWFDNNAIAIKGSTLLREDDKHKFQSTELGSTEEAKHAILEYFPLFGQDEILAALKNIEYVKGLKN